jgi:hypothetical protein
MQYEYEKYVCTPEEITQMIEQYGVAIVPNVLSSEECEEMKKNMWDAIEQLTSKFEVPIDRANDKTWRSFYDLFPLHSMLVQHHSIGHSKLAWSARTNAKVIECFEKIWMTDAKDLLTSFDGASIHLPPEITNKGWLQPKKVSGLGSLHTDQTFHTNDFECIQSWVTAFDVNEGDATFTFLEGSNKYHKEFADTFNVKSTQKKNDNWYQIKEQDQLDFYVVEKNCEKKSIRCPAGSMVFWDSRTIHSGQEAVKTRKNPNFRCVVYVCMLPRKLSDPKNLKKKIKAFEERRTTTHNPCIIKLFSKSPRTYGKEVGVVGELEEVKLDSKYLYLAGF